MDIIKTQNPKNQYKVLGVSASDFAFELVFSIDLCTRIETGLCFNKMSLAKISKKYKYLLKVNFFKWKITLKNQKLVYDCFWEST